MKDGALSHPTGSPDLKIVISGIGGQGVLFLARLLYALGTGAGARVLGSETHGMSQRGGSVLSHVKIGPYASPMVRMGTADLLLGLHAEQAPSHLLFLKQGGTALLNAGPSFRMCSEVAGAAAARGIEIRCHDAKAIAVELEFPQAANLILLAHAVQSRLVPFALDQLAAAIAAVSPPPYRSRNLTVLEAAAPR